jgi:GDP/UDP-N,N'-diacetylbacillosamine 2-epimerase (hydrolysing)
MRRKICVVTGTRAEYGLLRWVMQSIRETPELALQVMATGMHLSPEFGLTYRDIENDGFRVDRKVEMLLSSDTPAALAKAMGLGMIGFGDAFQQLEPDLLLVLGDRFEIFSAVAAALTARIPVGHVHGGETTEGAFDEGIRHSITKMSHLHFVAAEEYRRRVIQLGEHPDRVFLVGGLGIDSIRNLELLNREELEAALGFQLGQKNLLITFHPVTLERFTAAQQMVELFAALDTLEGTQLIFTMPNADTDGRVLCGLITEFVASHRNACAFTSLGQLRYLSCIRHVDGVCGNSSSGLTEAPSFRKGTINIGDRQRGRLKAESVIDCSPDRHEITAALERLYSPEFQATLETVRNPYGEGGASEKIVRVLRDYPIQSVLKKSFFMLGTPGSQPEPADASPQSAEGWTAAPNPPAGETLKALDDVHPSDQGPGEQWRMALLSEGATIQQAITNLNQSCLQIVLLVRPDGTLIGTVTDGDIRRGLLRGLTLDGSVDAVVNKEPLVVPRELERTSVLNLMRANVFRQLPVVDEAGRVVGLHLLDELLVPTQRPNLMVIMAGGRGTRLRPMTDTCPKPLLPVSGHPMLEHILLRAKSEGFQHFVLAVHYLGQMIEDYFGDGSRWQVQIEYLREETPVGTAGALALLENRPDAPFIVTNGDVLTDIRCGELLSFHCRNAAAATMAVSLREWQYPFGVVHTKGVDIVELEEKPIARRHVNAGIYVLEPRVLDHLITGEHCDMPVLFSRLKERGERTIVYPMHEPWLDVGREDDFNRAQSDFSPCKLAPEQR